VSFTGWSISGPVGASPVAHGGGSQGLWSCWGAGWCGLSQNSTYTVQAAGETLTAGVWAKTEPNVGPNGAWFNLQLWLNGSQVAFAQPNFPASQDWTNITTSYVTTAADIGKTVGISFGTDAGQYNYVSGYASYCYMDDASLTTSAASLPPTGGGTASPNPANIGDSVLVTVAVTNGTSPTITSVTLNASPIGGSSAVALVSAGGNLYTNRVTVTGATNFYSPMNLQVSMVDALSATGFANIALSVNPPTNLTWGGGNGNWTAANWLPGNVGGPQFTNQTAVVTNGSVTVNVSGGVGAVAAIKLANTGVLRVNNSFYGSYGNILFQGGSLDTSDGSSYRAYGSSLLTAVTAGGSATSTIVNNPGGWFNLAYPSSTFTVSNGATLNVIGWMTLRGAAWGGVDDSQYQPSALVKAGGGTLVLSGENQYAGGTVAAAGTLSLSNSAALLAASSLTVSNGAVVNLGYAGSLPLGSLVLGGVVQPAGTHGATGSGATHINNTYFTGPGVLNVVALDQVLTWTGAINSFWDASTANWTNAAGYNRWYNNLSSPNSAIFGATGVGTVTLTGATIARSITFNNAGYTLTGATLTLMGARAITNNVNATIATPLDSSGLNKFGTGTLTLNGASRYLGGLSVNAGMVSLTGSVLSGCTAVSIAAGAQMDLNFTGTNVIGSLTLNGSTLPVGTYNAQHPVYGSYFTGAGSLRIFPLTYQLSPGNESWPADIRAGIVTFMKEGVEAYNTNGHFPMFVWVNYDSSVGTANAGYGGPITFGGYRDTFVAIHELAHCLGAGTYYPAWANNQSTDGWWIGTHADQRIKLYDGPTAHIGCDSAHFSPYGLNYVQEDTPTGRYRHTKIIAAMRRDMGIVGDTNSDGVPDDWDMFWFGTLTPPISSSNNLAAYLADVSPIPFVPTSITAVLSGTNLTVSWPTDHLGSALLVQTNNLHLGISANANDWMRMAGSTGTTQVIIPITGSQPTGFYRLVYP
jgi:autotransporter-associated beta strand protein